MEHRYGTRFPTDLKTLIFKNGMPVAIGRIHNFSHGGVFVKTEFEFIDINQPLEIELIARGVSSSSECSGERKLCKTFVMHKWGEGLGLMLREDCVETQNNFAAFVAEELSRSRQRAVTAAATPVEPAASSASVLPLANGKNF